MLTRRQWLLSTPAFAGAKALHAEPAQHRLIKAGPFSIQCPAEWAEGIVVEKVPRNPLYTHEQWLAFQANPANNLKAWYINRPEHWAIRIPRLAISDTVSLSEYGGSATAPQILIHETAGWAGIFEAGSPTQAQRIEKTRKIRAYFNNLVNDTGFWQLPIIGDGAFDFLCLRRKLVFSGGKGIRMLGQWCIDPSLLWREKLTYLFVGMSDDDSCCIVATFPMQLDGLPSYEDENASHLGYNGKDRRLEKEFQKYHSLAVNWLETREDLIEPKITALDAMMESLRAVTWE